MPKKKKSLVGWLAWEQHCGLGLLDKKPEGNDWCSEDSLSKWVNNNFGYGKTKVRITIEEL